MAETDERDLSAALKKGVRRHCPQCGGKTMFSGYLSVNEACGECGLEFHHHRADDMHPWITIVIVGHVIVPLMLTAVTQWNWPDWLHMVFWPMLVVVLSMTILPFAKGFVIALQWALKMHGFGRGT